MLSYTNFEKYVMEITEENIEIDGRCHIFNHLYIEDQELINRAVQKNIYGASTFDVSIPEIIQAIKDALMEYSVDLTDWVNDPKDYEPMVAILETEKCLGHGFYSTSWHTWRNGACNCHRIAVVLEKIERKYDTFFKIKTVYCEPTDADIADCAAKRF